jgi:hypothetical protein
MSTEFNLKPFHDVRRDLRDLVTVPVQSWLMIPSARRTVPIYRSLTEIPMDLAAAGFRVTVMQGETGWSVEIEKDVIEGATLHLTGQARSYAAALFQLANQAAPTITDLENAARATWGTGTLYLGGVA